jgi:transposase
MTPEERSADLEAEPRRLRADQVTLREPMARLLERVQVLEGRVAQDRHNSSKPPASDGRRRTTPRVRPQRGQQPGGQLGQRGTTWRRPATPDVVVAHRPALCGQCQAALPDAPGLVRARPQGPDRPPRRRPVSEQHVRHRRCPSCQPVRRGACPPAAPRRAPDGPPVRARAVSLVTEQVVPLGRVPALRADRCAVPVGRGTLVAWVPQAAAVLAPGAEHIQAAVRQAPGRQLDEPGVRRGGPRAWAPGASMRRRTHDPLHAPRGRAATDASGSLPALVGVRVPDGGASDHLSTACRPARGHVQHRRALTCGEEAEQPIGAKDRNAVLLPLRAATDQARARGRTQGPAAQRMTFQRPYRARPACGRRANPPPDSPRRPGQRGPQAPSAPRTLLARLTRDAEQVLALRDDLPIPCANTQAERDLRRFTVQQQISGCFSSDPGADAFCTLRSVLSTWRKQGRSGLTALEAAFTGHSLSLQPPS